MSRKRLLFSGSAWVHFVCALPVCRRLAEDPRFEVWFTGGYKKETAGVVSYTLDGFYDPFPIDRDRVIPVERARQEDFDVMICSHLSPALPRSVGKTVQVFHGVSFKNLGVREKYLAFDYLCLAGRYHAEAYLKNGLVRKAGQCLVTGAPKMDVLVSGTLDRAALLRRLGLDPARLTILYAPTGSKHNSLETLGTKVISAIAGTGKWNLAIKLHDHPKNTEIDWAREIGRMESDRVKLVRDPDVVPYLHAADLVITDASSVSVEFTLMDRPVVFIDVPDLLKDVVDRGGALDLETHGRKFGTVVGGAEEAVAAIADAFENPERHGALRRAAALHVFHDPGGATDRVTGVVLHAAGLAPALPAGVEVLQPDQSTSASSHLSQT